MSPPPLTSQVTKQSAADADDFHAMLVATSELSRTIDVTSNAHVSNIDLFILVDAVHSSQHCKWRGREREKMRKMMIFVKFCNNRIGIAEQTDASHGIIVP